MINKMQKKNIIKQFNRFSIKYPILEPTFNEFKEYVGEKESRFISGIYHYKSSVSKEESAPTVKHYMTVLNIDNIKEGVIILIDNKKHKVIHIEDTANLGMSYVLTLEEINRYDRSQPR